MVTNLSARTIDQVKHVGSLEAENAEIKEMKQRIETILNTAAEGIITFDNNGIIEGMNHAAEKLFGYSENEAIGMSIQSFIPLSSSNFSTSKVLTKETIYSYLNALLTHDSDTIGKNKSGLSFPISITVGDTLLDGTQIYTAVISDISGRKKIEAARRNSLAELNQIFNSAAGAMCVISTGFKILRANDTFCKLFGFNSQDLIGKKCHEVLPDRPCSSGDCPMEQIKNGTDRVEIECTKKNSQGKYIPCILTSTPLLSADGTLLGMIEDYKDITERKELEAKLHEISITDDLTGLFNRRGFMAMAEKQLAKAGRSRKPAYLLYADLDNMKWINDTFGHKVGDQALIEAAELLKKTFRLADVIGRLGGDEFVVLLSDDKLPDQGQAIINRFEDAIKIRNENQKEREYSLQLSTGISHFDPEMPCSVEDLLNRADACMYEVKHSKKMQSRPVFQ